MENHADTNPGREIRKRLDKELEDAGARHTPRRAWIRLVAPALPACALPPARHPQVPTLELGACISDPLAIETALRLFSNSESENIDAK